MYFLVSRVTCVKSFNHNNNEGKDNDITSPEGRGDMTTNTHRSLTRDTWQYPEYMTLHMTGRDHEWGQSANLSSWHTLFTRQRQSSTFLSWMNTSFKCSVQFRLLLLMLRETERCYWYKMSHDNCTWQSDTVDGDVAWSVPWYQGSWHTLTASGVWSH